MDYLGSDNCVRLEELTKEALCGKIDRALTETDLSGNLAHLKNLAAENGRLAGKLLRGQPIE
jgi:hypothetical protein